MIARVWLAARYLFDRLTGPRRRAAELLLLRRRLAGQAGPGRASPAEAQLAGRLRDLRERLAAQLGPVTACARCMQPPTPGWPGGRCCAAETQALFGDHELAALRLTGTTPGRLRPPRSPHAGCAFRGPDGCSLPVAHRPSVCVGYACRELLAELRQRGDAPVIAQLQEELQRVFQRFVAEHTARVQAELFDELAAGLRAGSAAGPPAADGLQRLSSRTGVRDAGGR